jgi:hypothetical protein
MTARATETVTRFAADELARRRDTARRKLAAGELDPARADDLLRPWAAIALLAGVAPEAIAPDCASALALRRGTLLDEGHARALLAADLCPPLRWSQALGAARDRAVETASSGDVASAERARQLRDLAKALSVTLPYRPRPVPAERKEAA